MIINSFKQSVKQIQTIKLNQKLIEGGKFLIINRINQAGIFA